MKIGGGRLHKGGRLATFVTTPRGLENLQNLSKFHLIFLTFRSTFVFVHDGMLHCLKGVSKVLAMKLDVCKKKSIETSNKHYEETSVKSQNTCHQKHCKFGCIK